MIVIDANVLTYSVVSSQETAFARRVAEIDGRWIVPPLWKYEVTSALLKLVRGRAIGEEDAITALSDAAKLVSGREIPVDQIRVLQAARHHGVSAYDAQYLVLARTYGTVCVTGDRELADKAPSLAVHHRRFVRST